MSDRIELVFKIECNSWQRGKVRRPLARLFDRFDVAIRHRFYWRDEVPTVYHLLTVDVHGTEREAEEVRRRVDRMLKKYRVLEE